MELLNLILPNLIIALLGWFIGNRLSDQRKQKEQRRLININYLINAYRNLENWVRNELTNDLKKNVENAIADIQLFGTQNMISKLNKFLDSYSYERSDVEELLNSLREELRKELGMEHLDTYKTQFFRFLNK